MKINRTKTDYIIGIFLGILFFCFLALKYTARYSYVAGYTGYSFMTGWWLTSGYIYKWGVHQLAWGLLVASILSAFIIILGIVGLILNSKKFASKKSKKFRKSKKAVLLTYKILLWLPLIIFLFTYFYYLVLTEPPYPAPSNYYRPITFGPCFWLILLVVFIMPLHRLFLNKDLKKKKIYVKNVEVTETLKCDNCGSILSKDDKYCNNCQQGT